MELGFSKMQGLGNDFVLVDLVSQRGELDAETARRLGDRRLGIGFDQLLAVLPPERGELDFKYLVFNADGSAAEQCGNGARCLLRFVRDRGLTGKRHLWFEAPDGVVEGWLEADGQVTMDFGPPALAPADVPFVAEGEVGAAGLAAQEAAGCRAALPEGAGGKEGLAAPVREGGPMALGKGAGRYRLALPEAEGGAVQLAAVGLGNPHAVVRVRDVGAAPVAALGSAIGGHARFPAGANVGFMEVASRQAIRLRVHERGVGETPACGSGACAAVVAGRLWGLLDESVEVALPGGALNVRWAGEGAGVQMTGPACHVYDGQVRL